MHEKGAFMVSGPLPFPSLELMLSKYSQDMNAPCIIPLLLKKQRETLVS